MECVYELVGETCSTQVGKMEKSGLQHQIIGSLKGLELLKVFLKDSNIIRAMLHHDKYEFSIEYNIESR